MIDKLNIERQVIENYLTMINDVNRNSYYKEILQDTVKNKHCLEVGFGTGILSIIACEAGAKSVTAYEHAYESYKIGKDVIDRLGLSSKIHLIKDTFNKNKIYNHPEVEVIFSETVDGLMWGENWFQNLVDDPTKLILPGKYFLEAFQIEVCDNYAIGALEPASIKFNPGIDLNKQFINLINEKLSITEKPVLKSGLHQVNYGNNGNFWGWHSQPINYYNLESRDPDVSYLMDVNNKQLIFSHHLTKVTEELSFTAQNIEFDVNLKKFENKNCLILLRAGFLGVNDKKFYLDQGHFGPINSGFLIVGVEKNSTMKISHSLLNGSITGVYNDYSIQRIYH